MYMDIKQMAGQGKGLDNAYLKVVNRLDSLNFKMQEHYIVRGTLTLGRSSKSDIVIKDKFVSKNHLKIFERNNSYYIEDNNSANGTYLNGNRVDSNEIIQLQNGDRIGVGFIQFIFVENR